MREIRRAIIHCSDSYYGNAKLFKEWHRSQGWTDIGYHYVILNCFPTAEDYKEKKPNLKTDGVIESGRHTRLVGAHCLNQNEYSLGICLVGKREFTGAQLFTLRKLLSSPKYSHLDIFGHYEFNDKKTCPNIDMDYLREMINGQSSDRI